MRRLVLGVVGVLAFVLVPALPASAHPLGNFTVNRYDGVLVHAGGVRVDHVVDLAEIPTVQARSAIDTDRDGKFGRSELARWAGEQCAKERSLLGLDIAGRTAALSVTSATARSIPGEAGLATLRLECQIAATARFGSGKTGISFRDDAPQQVGWREITVRGDAMTISASGAALPRSSSLSRRLTSYPEDLLSSPLNERAVAFRVSSGGGSAAEVGEAQDVLPRPTERLSAAFTGLVGGRDLGVGAGVLAIGLALLIGAMHAVAPGHGKTIMAFYLVGRGESRSRAARAALTVGATVTLTHTAGVLVLGLIVGATASATPAAAYPWLAAASGLVIAVVGLGLLREALRRRRAGVHGHSHGPGTHSHGFGSHSHGPAHEADQHGRVGGGQEDDHPHPHPHASDDSHEHPHPHEHPRPHEHGTDESHENGHGTDHEHPHEHEQEHPHEHEHPHPHEHEHPHPHPHEHEHPHPHEHEHEHEHEHPHPHPHEHEHPHPHEHEHEHGAAGGHDHDHPHPHPLAHGSGHPGHLVPAALGVGPSAATTAVLDRPASASRGEGTLQQASTHPEASLHLPNVVESRPGRRGRAGLIAVGIAGGLVPSPSALVVLLGAAAVGRAWFGVVLVVAFGVGMAMTLSATGLLLVLAQDKFKRFSHPRWKRAGRFYAIFPVVSASAVCILGLYLTLRGLTALP